MSFFQIIDSTTFPAWWTQQFAHSTAHPFPECSHKDFMNWKMELHDAPILKWIYRNKLPNRHLEFGTWQGFGTRLCLQSCNATVWTMNLWEGENKDDGSWAYGEPFEKPPVQENATVQETFTTAEGDVTYYRTDALGFIGRLYREAGLGHRVNQIYCDSRLWDHSNYPKDFFDTVLIDGGHTPEMVISDTRKAIQVTGSKALVMWHDFCPLPEVRAAYETPAGVYDGLSQIQSELKENFSTLVWIEPSWILIGIRK